MFSFDFPFILNQSSYQVRNTLCSSVFRYVFSSDLSPLHKGIKRKKKKRTKQEQKTISFVTPQYITVVDDSLAPTIQYNTIRVYCENTLSYNNGVLSQTEPKSGSVKARQLIYIYSTNTIKLRVEKKKKLDMEYSII